MEESYTYAHFNENSNIPNIKVIRDYLESVKCDNFDEVFLRIENKDYDALKELLAKENPTAENSLFFARDGEDRTPLMFAALLGDLEAVKILLQPFKGIEAYKYIGITSKPFNWNAIFYAIFGENVEILAVLSEKSKLDYFRYRDIFNWSTFDYLMLNERLYIAIEKTSFKYDILTKWIDASLNDTGGEIPQNGDRLPIPIKDLCKAGIVSSESSMPLFRALICKKMAEASLKGELRSMYGKKFSEGYENEEVDYLYGRKSVPDARLILNGEKKYNIFYFYYFSISIASLEGNKEILKRLAPIMETVSLGSVNRKDKKLLDYICANIETFEEKITLLCYLFGEKVKESESFKVLLKNSKLTLEEKMKVLNLKTKEEYVEYMIGYTGKFGHTQEIIDMFDL